MHFDPVTRLFHRFGAVVAGMAMLTALGCGAGVDTQASFEGGADDNPMDGATVEDDGNMLRFGVNAEGTGLDEVEITTASGGQERVLFDGAISSDIAIPRSIETEAGNTFSFDRNSNTAQVTTTLPFSSSTTTFTFGNLPADLPLFTRSASQTAGGQGCSEVRDSVDEFCGFYQANQEAALEELVRLATDIAVQQVDESLQPFVPDFVRNVITDFFETLDLVCNSWTEMREGSSEAAGIDPCESF